MNLLQLFLSVPQHTSEIHICTYSANIKGYLCLISLGARVERKPRVASAISLKAETQRSYCRLLWCMHHSVFFSELLNNKLLHSFQTPQIWILSDSITGCVLLLFSAYLGGPNCFSFVHFGPVLNILKSIHSLYCYDLPTAQLWPQHCQFCEQWTAFFLCSD